MIDVKRALVDLAKDRNGVAGIGSKHEGSLILDWLLERQLGARKYADSHRTILRRGESSGTGAKVVCDEFFAHFGWACLHRVQTVVAHKGTPHVGAPRSAILTETTPRRINPDQAPPAFAQVECYHLAASVHSAARAPRAATRLRRRRQA